MDHIPHLKDSGAALLQTLVWQWASSMRWWKTGKPGVLQSMGSLKVGHNWATEQQESRSHLYLFVKNSRSTGEQQCGVNMTGIDPYFQGVVIWALLSIFLQGCSVHFCSTVPLGCLQTSLLEPACSLCASSCPHSGNHLYIRVHLPCRGLLSPSFHWANASHEWPSSCSDSPSRKLVLA